MGPKKLFARALDAFSRWRKAVADAVKSATRPPGLAPVTGAVLDLARSKVELVAENALLRQQMIVLQRSVKQPRLRDRDRVLIVLLARLNVRWRDALLIVQPKTLLGWHRRLFRLFWKWKTRPRRGRAPIPQEAIDLIRKMARENATWGAERIRGELLKLGIRVSKRTVHKYMAGSSSGGSGQRSQTWTTFLANHSNEIWACDFLQTFDFPFRPIFLFFMIEHGSREVVHAAVTRHPTREWTAQQLREATPFGEGPRFLIRDNDDEFGRQFDHVAEGPGIEIVKTPVKAPRANAVGQRFLGSVRRECLDHMLIMSEKHLRRLVSAHVAYFDDARPHQGIEQRLPRRTESVATASEIGKVIALPVLGGLHHDYRRAA